MIAVIGLRQLTDPGIKEKQDASELSLFIFTLLYQSIYVLYVPAGWGVLNNLSRLLRNR